METLDSNTPDDALRRLLKGRLWGIADTEAVTAIEDSAMAVKVAAAAVGEESRIAVTNIKIAAQAAIIRANEAAEQSESAIANIADALDKALATIRTTTSRSMEPEPEPELMPIDLDETYSEKDLAAAALDSVMWVAFECRRMMVRHGLKYRVDYSHATRKPPTALAMWMAEYYVNYPEKLDRLFQRVTRPSGPAAEKPTRPENRPKTKDELDAEAYLRSVGLLPPEEKTP